MVTRVTGVMPLRLRIPFVVTIVAATWLGLAFLGNQTAVDLVIVLLPLLLLTLIVGAFAGVIAGVISALAFVLMVNWYLVPPVHTLSIASTESRVALLVFVIASILASLLTDRVILARAQAAATLAERTLISNVVEDQSAATALNRLRLALALDSAVLTRIDSPPQSKPLIVDPASTSAPMSTPVVDVVVLDEYRLQGFGPERIATDRGFVESLASAVARAYESEMLQQEKATSARLLDLDKSRSALLASVGHDLRTPLSTIRISSEALTTSGSSLSSGDARELLQTINDASRHLDELITNLLDMSRIESGALISQAEEVDLELLVSRAMAEVGSEVVELQPGLGPLSVQCDPALLDRVLVNLLSNAITHQGGDRPVSVRYSQLPSEVTISVIDHGVGIEPGLIEAAMRPFSQVGTRADGGSGAGLSIADAFCHAMGGRLELARTQGGGLTATVVLPKEEA